MCERLTAGNRKGYHSLKTVKILLTTELGHHLVKNKSHEN
jgi:hypothetical protein